MKYLKLAIGLHIAAAATLASRAFAHGTAQEVADLWSQGISNAQQKMTAGVLRTTQNPAAQAIAKRQKFVASMQDPATFDKWEAGLRGTTLQSWQAAMTGLGIQRAAQGAGQKKDKFAKAMGALLPFVDQLQGTVRGMPDNTIADREQRMLAWSRGMRGYRKPAGG